MGGGNATYTHRTSFAARPNQGRAALFRGMRPPRPKSEDNSSNPFYRTIRRSLQGRPLLAAVILAAGWGLPGLFLMPILHVSGAEVSVLWSIGATFLLTFSVLSAILGLFARHWWWYTASCGLCYLGLTVLYALAVMALSRYAIEELGAFMPMYSAFFLGFFMINAVAAVVRRIAGYSGLHDYQ